MKAPENPDWVELQGSAPAKPSYGARCNGCGVCCASTTCPLGRLRYLRRTGPCPALIWRASLGRYSCGLAEDPRRLLPGLPEAWLPLFRRLILRWIGEGWGCDSQGGAADAPKEP